MQEENVLELSQRVLIIDDEEHIRLLLKETLQTSYEVNLQNSGDSAIEAVKESLELDQPFGVAIMDLNMPGMLGTTVAKKLRELDERIHLILMTGESKSVSEIVDESFRQNLILVRKPFALDEIIMLTQYLFKTWKLARTLEHQSLELKSRIDQSEAIRSKIEAIFETALDCIINIDHESRITEWNPAAENTFGFTREEILGRKLTDTIIPQSHLAGHSAGMKKLLQFGEGPILGKRIEIIAQNKQGAIFPVELAVTQIEGTENPGFTAYLRDISVQKEAEQQMKLQSKTLEAAANGIIITDVKGVIVWANPAFLSLTGYSDEEIIGHSTRMLKSGEHPKSFYENLWHTIIEGNVWNGEMVNCRKDGSQYAEDMTITPITDENDNIVNFIAIKQDVTARKQLNEQLLQNEKRLRIINYFSTSLAGSNTIEEILWDITRNCISEMELEDAVVYLMDDDGLNLIQQAAFGPDKEKDSQVLNPLIIPLGEGIVGTAASSQKTIVVEDVKYDPRYIIDGEMRGSELAVPIVYENSVIGVIDSENTEVSFFTGFHVQIIEAIASLAANKIMRTISIERTKKSEMKYRSIFESIQDVYAEVDYNTGEIIEISPSVKPFSGYSRDEVMGKPLAMFYPPEQPPEALFNALKDEGSVNDFEVILMDKSGQHREVSLTVSLQRDLQNDPTKIVGTMRDITVRKQAEKAVHGSALIKTNFVSNVSHELRTPMASILGFAGTILRDKNMADDTKMDFVRIINEEAQRLTRLIENVLDISKMEAGTISYTMQTVHLEDVVSEVIDSQKVLAQKKDISLNIEIGKNLKPLHAATDSISQLAVNLISNAIKFTDRSGTVGVKISRSGHEQTFEVSDTGLGIPQEDIERIFDKFYRVEREKREDEGTGIGLAIVKEIADMHNAKLEVESVVGKGTKFRVIFPV
ncbi:MAG: PAS domain S-box protein [Candidatus Marinimicrobia bacterium]|nr:PAS domain S-box protein [Candidatus Neomarinimicrobiota bacterium]MBT4362431.1 PAS domain S-box protein [Candidatus Neomarinimicrobiota bacterium]MBT4713414.1 PAS domain S-box protein [Candidatus Neomarinimicrobiota bacterium]MBT4946339.1 PAS domain S-box protein [Candidatus Neomarinimicrobiota bacterium]MBT5312988.1 PAS domain S-box protein [Candidatus Neomarinimicrobiota bacterium]